MSSISSFLTSLEQNLAMGLLEGALSNSISTGLQAFLQADPATASLPAAETYVNTQLNSFLAQAIAKLPGWEQPIADTLLLVDNTAVQNWVNEIVAQVYTKLVSQIVGTNAGKAIVAGA